MSARLRLHPVILALALSSCGYALVGRGTSVDPDIKVVGVPTFRDRTGRPGLDQEVTDLVIEELLKRGRFQVVNHSAGADAVVDGEITSYQARPVGFSGGDTTEASRYSVVLSANVTYKKVGQREPIWQNPAFRANDEWDVGDPEAFFDREEQAVDRLAKQFARELVAAMMEAF
jgi:Lipopolysaccharide-assembly